MNRSNYVAEKDGPRQILLQKSKDLYGCPKCHGDQVCGCVHCLKNNPGREKEVSWKWTADGENIICGHCGFTESADYWQDREADYYRSMMELYGKDWTPPKEKS